MPEEASAEGYSEAAAEPPAEGWAWDEEWDYDEAADDEEAWGVWEER